MRRVLGSSRALRLALATSLIASLVVVAVERPVRAATQTFTTTADAQVQEANPSTTFGTSTALRVDAGSDPDVESYLRFAVSGVSGSVQTATLRLWVTSATANGPAVYTTDNTWSETTITWANRTARTGSGVDDKASIPSGAWVDFNVTSLVPGDGTYNFVLAGTSSDGVDFSSREATNKPQLVVTTAASNDVTNPSDPTGLGAVAISSGRVDLSWTASTDNVGVTGYEIFRNGTLLTSVGAVTTFADTTAAPSTAYTYQVRAFDAAGNRSGLSASASTTTPAAPSTTTSTFAPTADAYVAEATSSTNFGTSTTLRVDAGTDPDVESYIRFPVTGLTGSIQSAKLRLWVGTDATGNGPAVYTTASTWSESSITWANRTARVGTGTDDKARSRPTPGSSTTCLADRGQRHIRLRVGRHLDGRHQLLLSRGRHQQAAARDRDAGLQRHGEPQRSIVAVGDADLRDQGRPELDGLHRQHRRDELRDLPEWLAAHDGGQRHVLRRHVGGARDDLRLQGPSPRRCGQSLRIQQHGQRDDAARHGEPDAADAGQRHRDRRPPGST